ncbi:hypothetical protein DsansV1_C21g0166401 [Dioscorea sansibarensis]
MNQKRVPFSRYRWRSSTALEFGSSSALPLLLSLSLSLSPSRSIINRLRPGTNVGVDSNGNEVVVVIFVVDFDFRDHL